MAFDFRESFYSISKKDTIRGMHFQIPPFAQSKMVHLIHGSAMDVILDLRKDSRTYKKFAAVKISDRKRQALYIPKGCAHGFRALEDETVMIYYATDIYVPDCDTGIRWDSFGFDWGCPDPIMSERDKQFGALEAFDSPF